MDINTSAESNFKLLLLGTSGCHLCEEAELIIADVQVGFRKRVDIEKVDIAEQEQWQQHYALRIPVLYHPGSSKHLCWPFNQEELKIFLNEL